MRPPEVITSRSNPLVKRLRALKERGVEGDLALLEGVKLIEEALATGIGIEEAAVAPRLRRSPRGRRVLEGLESRRVVLREVEEGILASISETETSQGILALAHRLRFEEERLFEGTPLVLIVAGIQDPGNLGGLLRTAEAAGATGAYLARGTADPLSWKALRGSMGSAFRLPHVRGLSSEDAVDRVKARGVATLASVSADGEPYDRVDLRGPIAILLGNEASGLPESLLQSADRRVRIPMRGPVESLNVGVAAGILLFEAARQRSPAPP